MSEEAHKIAAGSAVSSVMGGTKGMFAGGLAGGGLWMTIGAAGLAAAGAVASLFIGAEAGSALTTGNLALTGAIVGGIGGGLAGMTVGTIAGGISGAIAANQPSNDGPSKEQVAQLAYAQGMMQGATVAKLEAVEAAQHEISTKWQDRVGPKKQHDSHVAMVNDQAAAALAAMEPAGRA